MSGKLKTKILSALVQLRTEIGFLYDFIAHLIRYRNLMIVAIISLALSIASELSIPIIIRETVDRTILEGALSKLPLYAVFLIIAILLNSTSRYFVIYLTNSLGQNILHDIRCRVFGHVLKLPMNFFDRTKTGKLVVRVTSDVENLNELFVSGLIVFLADIFIIIGIIAVMLLMNIKLTLVALLTFPIMIIVVVVFRKRASNIYTEIRRKIAELNSFISESIMGIKTVKLIPARIYCINKFSELNREYSEEVRRGILIFSFFFSSIILFSSFSLASVLWFGGIKIIAGELSFGTFIAFWYAVTKLFEPIWDFSEKYNIFQSAVASAKRISEILREKTEEEILISTKDGKEDKITRNEAKLKEIEFREIEFRNVYFSYDGEKWVLKGANFKIQSGEKVAIVGLTGAGKTTIANLITRMYIPQKGQILIDGEDISEYDIKELRKKVAVVHQDIFTISGKVIDNIITLGTENSDMENGKETKIKDILKIAEEIGINLEKEISEDGVGLSGGEKQIVSLLRAIYVDAPVIILDEATAFVDPETEEKINKILDKLRGKTIIKIAHRPSTIRTADKIIAIREGKVFTNQTQHDLHINT